MRALALTIALVALSLAVIAVAVFGFGDGRTFVSPPGAVMENFVRSLQCRRFPQAHKFLSSSARAHVGVDALADATARLESRVGAIEDVHGEDGWLRGDDAEASAVLRAARAGDARVTLRLHRESGEWRVVGIEGLAP